MQPILWERPRELALHKPVRIVLTGGFLGAGKTTALGALAKRLRLYGLTAGVITNDQAVNLVDTAILRELDLPVAEVAGGCFCCRFNDLLDAAQVVLAQQPDVLLCEPVGSCTDMTATVLNPLKRFYGDQLQFAPFTVLVDPLRASQHLQGVSTSLFPPEVDYIFGKQLEEADLIALNKTDTLLEAEVSELVLALQERYRKPIIRLSGLSGQGIAEWMELLLGEMPAGAHTLRELDYDTYARGEAVLGWLNATAEIQGQPDFEGDAVVQNLMQSIQEACQKEGAEIAHLKIALAGGERSRRAHLTTTADAPLYHGDSLGRQEHVTLIVNARVRIAPDLLGGIVVTSIQGSANQTGAQARIASLQAFSPAYPRPPYRITGD